MSRRDIILSPKHGVNPTMVACFFCRKETGEIALLGRLPNDEEAPRYMVMDVEPCAACSEIFSQGHLVLEAIPGMSSSKSRFTINGSQVTGTYWLLKPSEDHPAGGKSLVSPEAAKELGLHDFSPEIH